MFGVWWNPKRERSKLSGGRVLKFMSELALSYNIR